MIRTVVQPHEIGVMIRERTAVLLRMTAFRLNPKWVTEFSLLELNACCDRLAVTALDISAIPDQLQRELIQNPDFGPWLIRLLSLFEAKSEAASDEEESQSSMDQSKLLKLLADLLEASWEHSQVVTAYQPADVLAVLEQSQLNYSAKLAYLAGYAPMDLSVGRGAQIIKNLSVCGTVPVPLSAEQRALLEEPFVETRSLFAEESFKEIAELFGFCPELADIARLLHQEDVPEDLRLEDYVFFAEDVPEYLRLMTLILHRLGRESMGAFIQQWQENTCSLFELRCMERRVQASGDRDWCEVLSTYSGYVNLLYGDRFKTLSLASLDNHQEKLITYAIINNKKHFIKLIDENGDQFLNLPYNSILFCEELYRAHFNLNELTARDLTDCERMPTQLLSPELLEGGRQYTFAELKLLYGASKAYATVYRMLRTDDLDYKIKVLRQLLKRNALKAIEDEGELSTLAGYLDKAALYDWRDSEFKHIEELTAGDTAQMLVHLSELRHLLPTMRCRTDAVLALRSLEHLAKFDSMDALKASLLEIDGDWRALSEDMGLSPEFMARYQERIIQFLCRDGAGISHTYAESLNDGQRASFYRVVKAELMDQFSTLKYFEGDLERELGCSVPSQTKEVWQENLSVVRSGMEVHERDDFFSTILLGTQPYHTCLAYSDGCYNHCLLACFDSNKKVLYAEMDGHIVGRASIRLTKCRQTSGGKDIAGGAFNFVDLEDVSGSRKKEAPSEAVALFLERPYISGVGPEIDQKVRELFITLVQQKAANMGAALVLSMEYHYSTRKDFAQTRLDLYISASKAGEQYLDSLGGAATVSSEGSYRSGSFLVWQPDKRQLLQASNREASMEEQDL